jgi:hypothetical protein
LSFATAAIESWAQWDAPAAAAFAASQRDPSFRAALARELVTIWGRSDPASALAWAQQNLAGSANTEAIGNLIKSAAEKSLTVASQLVSDMEPGAAQDRACASIFETWFEQRPGERHNAIEWLATVPNAHARAAALSRVETSWIRSHPEEARDFVTGPHGAWAPDSLVHALASAQAEADPEAAMQWAGKLPADRVRSTRLAVLETWLRERPADAAAYVRSSPPGGERDEMIRHVSENFVHKLSSHAAEWYHSLSADEQKIALRVYNGLLEPPARAELEKALNAR